jgi:hypothetical protein
MSSSRRKYRRALKKLEAHAFRTKRSKARTIVKRPPGEVAGASVRPLDTLAPAPWDVPDLSDRVAWSQPVVASRLAEIRRLREQVREYAIPLSASGLKAALCEGPFDHLVAKLRAEGVPVEVVREGYALANGVAFAAWNGITVVCAPEDARDALAELDRALERSRHKEGGAG